MPLGGDEEEDAVDCPWQGETAQKEDEEDHVGQQGREEHHLQRGTRCTDGAGFTKHSYTVYMKEHEAVGAHQWLCKFSHAIKKWLPEHVLFVVYFVEILLSDEYLYEDTLRKVVNVSDVCRIKGCSRRRHVAVVM